MFTSNKDYYIRIYEELYSECFDQYVTDGYDESQAHAMATTFAEDHASQEVEDRMDAEGDAAYEAYKGAVIEEKWEG